MNEEKKVPFKWEYGEETISLQLGMYANNQRLYIGMITHTEDGAEPFADMTVNLRAFVENGPTSIMMTFQITLLPALIMLILFLALAFIVPVVALRLFNNRSVVERLRVNE